MKEEDSPHKRNPTGTIAAEIPVFQKTGMTVFGKAGITMFRKTGLTSVLKQEEFCQVL